VLRKYIPGAPEFLPYVKELPKSSTSQQKARGKQSSKPAAGVEDTAKKMQDLKV
jgi:seryl-tRNA synthetase